MSMKPKTIDAVAETVTDTARDSAEAAQTQFKHGYDKAIHTAEQFAKFQQGNLEAMVKAGQIFAAGLQDIGKHVAAQAQANFEEGTATFRALTSVKSLKEAIELQTSFAKTSLEKAMAESTKLTETSLKLAEQACAPLTARVNAAVETFTSRA